MIFQKRLRALRKERHETQVDVAKAIGVTDRQYQRFETGVNLPGFENFCALANHFGVSFVIDEAGMIEKVMPRVKPDTNAAEVLAYLRG